MDKCSWSERVVLVTGSTSGIGEAIALQFGSLGARVVFNSAHSVAQGEALASRNPNSIYVQADIAKEGDAERLIGTVLERFGQLDALINNAGVTKVIPHNDLNSASVDVWREIFEVNVFGTWALTVAAIDALRATSGAVVNISSIAGLRPSGSSIPYATSKAAINHMTALLAKAVGPNVRVNAVAPGLIDTPWTADWEGVRDSVQRLAPLKRSGQPEDVADLVVAMASMTYVTGQVVAVDGGFSLAT
jgi:ketoreductase RED2